MGGSTARHERIYACSGGDSVSDTVSSRLNPYVGPRAFEETDSGGFFGRDRELDNLLNLLIARRLVLLYAPSGAGKTSLIQAALIPRLRNEGFVVRRPIRVNVEVSLEATERTPNRYLLSTLIALDEELPSDQRTTPADLGQINLSRYLDQRRGDSLTDEVLIFDQFEELLTADATDRAAKNAFLAELGTALEDPRRWALFAIREDYLGQLRPLLVSLPTRLDTLFRLDLLDPTQARQAIQGPARAVGGTFHDAAATKLIDDLRQTMVQRPDGSSEPVLGQAIDPVQLQVVCYRIWERLPTGLITQEDVTRAGDVDTALRDYYSEQVAVAATVGRVGERTIRDWVARQLITEGGLRGQVLRAPEATCGLSNAAIRRLIDAHLVRAEERRGATWYELAHDRLIDPVRASNADWLKEHLSTFQRQADLWDQQGRPPGLLLRDAALAEAEAWAVEHAGELTDTEKSFLKACREAHAVEEHERRQARRIRFLAIFALIFCIIAALLYFQSEAQKQVIEQKRQEVEQQRQEAVAQRQEADQQRARAEREGQVNRARALANAAVANLGIDPDRSLLLARAAVQITRSMSETVVPEAVESLQQAIAEQRDRMLITTGPRGLQDLAISPNGSLLATTGNDGMVRIFAAASGQEAHYIQAGDVTNDIPALGLAFNPDGTRLVAGVADRALIWDTTTWQMIGTLEGHTAQVLNVAFSPDGTLIATASRDGTARLWDAATRQERSRLEGHDGEVNAVAFSPDGRRIATASDDGLAIIWNVISRTEVLTLTGHLDSVTAVAFSPDGTLIATSSSDLTVRLWDATDGTLRNVLRGHMLTIDNLSFDAVGERLATTSQDGTARIWNVAEGQLLLTLAGHRDNVSDAAFSADGARLTTVSLDGTIRQWDLALVATDGAYAAVYSPDSRRLATAGTQGVRIWDAGTGRALRFIATGSEVLALDYSPDGKQIAVANYDNLILLIDAANGVTLRTLEGHTNLINHLAYSPDGRTLASASNDRSVQIWDVASGTQLHSFAGHQAEVYIVTFSPDGATLASGDRDGKIIIWTAATGAVQHQMILQRGQEVQSLAFSPDGMHLVAGDVANDGDGLLALWDTASGAELRRLPMDATINDLAYSPDGTRLATAERNRKVVLREVLSLAPLQTLPHQGEVNTVAYSPDGKQIASTTLNGIAHIFPLELERLLALAVQRTVRGPTPVECVTYQLEGCNAVP